MRYRRVGESFRARDGNKGGLRIVRNSLSEQSSRIAVSAGFAVEFYWIVLFGEVVAKILSHVQVSDSICGMPCV